MEWQKFLRDFLILWATIDPISTVLIYAGLTSRLGPKQRRRVALRAILFSGIILVGSAILGQFILLGMGISLVSFQLAGGIVLFLFALQNDLWHLSGRKSRDKEQRYCAKAVRIRPAFWLAWSNMT
jgi:multiple antibiotic resistance protein